MDSLFLFSIDQLYLFTQNRLILVAFPSNLSLQLRDSGTGLSKLEVDEELFRGNLRHRVDRAVRVIVHLIVHPGIFVSERCSFSFFPSLDNP